MDLLAAAGSLAQIVPSPSPSASPSASPTPTPSPSGPPGTYIGIPKDPLVKIGDIGVLIGSLLAVMLIIAAVLAFIFIILGGLQWITSGGDKAGVEAARNKITNAIVGLIIVAAAWAVMLLVQNFLGINLFGGAVSIPRAF